jgi:hypothetical protein
VLSLVLALSGCGAGGGSDSATRPSTERSGTRPDPSGTESPSETTTEPTRPTRTSADTPPSTRTPTSAERPNSPTTTPATSAAGAPAAAAESEGLGALGWTLLIVLVVALVAGWLLWRSRRRSAWDAQAAALEQDARTATGTQLPPVLTAESVGQRALSWPPLRADLVDLMRRWDLLAERAPDDQRRNRTGQIRNLLQELVAALDAENQALGTGRDWRLLRPRVDQPSGRCPQSLLAYRNRSRPRAGSPGSQHPADDHLHHGDLRIPRSALNAAGAWSARLARPAAHQPQKEAIFQHTDTDQAPWVVVKSNDKRGSSHRSVGVLRV